MVDRYRITKGGGEIEIFKSMQYKNYIIVFDDYNDFKVRFHVDNYDTVKQILLDIYRYNSDENQYDTEYKMGALGNNHYGNWVIVERIPYIIELMDEYRVINSPSIDAIKLNGFDTRKLKTFSISILKKLSKEKLKG